MHWGSKRVAQAAPDPAPAGADQPPADGSAPPAADAPPPAPAPAAAPATVDTTPNLSDEELKKLAEQEAKEEVITVTGSTIERKTLTTPAPLTILNRDDLNAAGRSTVGDILQSLPAQSNAINAQANNGGDGSTRVDVRGLGARRTLTLINGRRVVPGGTGADASVDLNAIPLAVIERVEVLKDGASAVYGSDAIGGVVNIITRSDFDGTEIALYTGGSQHGDGFTYDASFVTGHNSENKKGNIIFSAGIQSQDPVFAGDRGFSDHDKAFNFTTRKQSNSGSTAIPGGRIDTTLIDTNHDGIPNSDPDAKDEMGNPIPVDVAPNICGAGVQYCTSNGAGGYRPYKEPDDFYNFQPVNYLYTPSSRYNVYSAGTYKLIPEVSTFFEASYLNRTSDQQLAPEPFAASSVVSGESIYNPYNGDVYGYRRRLEEFGPRRSLQNIDTFRIVAGFQGSVPEDAAALKNWKWEVSYNYGRTDAIQKGEGNLILSRLDKALGPSFLDGNNKAVCGTPTAPLTDGCVPMNILGPSGSIDPAARDYVTFTGISSGYNQQQTVLGQAHGRIAKLPNNGDLSLAVGVDYRKESGGFSPDPLTATGDTTGPATAPTDGSYNVAEGFGEISLVPISGQKFAEWVELNLAARAFHYNTFGNGVTWKAGGLFRTINGIAVRGTYSTAFRAPSVGELFAGAAEGFPPVEDPCDTASPSGHDISPMAAAECKAEGVSATAKFGTAQQKAIGGGNTKLKAETANVITAGVVFEPPQAKGLALTADYFNIDITQAIQALDAGAILENCYERGIKSYCMQVHRDPQIGNQIDFIDAPVLNVGGTATSGMDFAVVYDHKFGDAGRFREQLEAQYLFKYNLDNSIQVLHYRGNYDFSGVFPKVKANLAVAWSHPSGVGAGLNVRYVGSFKECQNNSCNTPGSLFRDVDAWYKGDIYVSYGFKNAAGRTTITAGVNNVLDRDPSLIYVGFAGDSDSSTYDYMGRFFYGRVSHLF